MFCKHCGQQIDNDSLFCRYCGSSQSNIETPNEPQKVKVEIEGEVKASLSPQLPKFTKVKNFVKNHVALSFIYGVWLIVNLLFLINGEGRNGFWPHTYTHRERVAEHTRLEYIPWTGQTVNAKYWDLGPEETKWDWDLDTYGWSEFLIYVVLIPLLLYGIFLIYQYFKKSNSTNSNRFNPSDGLRRY